MYILYRVIGIKYEKMKKIHKHKYNRIITVKRNLVCNVNCLNRRKHYAPNIFTTI
jgi:hypothetical protein